jgi:hypothetical protein
MHEKIVAERNSVTHRMTHLVKMMSILTVYLAIFAVVLRYLLAYIPEPAKVLIWDGLQATMPYLGAAAVVLLIIRARLSGVRSKPSFFGMLLVAVLCAAMPFVYALLGQTYPARIEATRPDLAVRVPFAGQVIVAWGGDQVRTNYHAAYTDQRWAYDLLLEPHSNGANELESFGCFGQPVLAPVTGEIRTAHDGEIDQTPNLRVPAGTNAFGNYIVIRPDNADPQTRLVLAHLKQGSLTVREGDIVTEGDPIAECGNSGQSTEPHLHIHYVMIQKALGETRLTGLPLYFRDHVGPPMPKGGFRNDGGISVASGDVIRHGR